MSASPAIAAAPPSDERLQAILESHPSAVVVVDNSGRISYANRRTCELLGYEVAELMGMPVDHLVPEALRSGHALNRGSYMADPQTRPVGFGRDLTARRKDGQLVPVEIGLSSFVSEGDRYVVAVVADITTRKAAEAALASIIGNLQALVAASPLAIMTLDLTGKVLLWNPAAEKMFGWTADEVGGRILPHVPVTELAEVREILRRVADGEVIEGMELLRRRKDGAGIEAELYAAPQRDGQGSVIGVIEQLADITGRRKFDEALLQTQKMESIGRLAGGVAHDFNNMLTAISGFAELLMQDLPAGSLELEHAETIKRASGQAAALTQQLLAFSRQQVLQPIVLDPDEAIGNFEPMLRRLLTENVDLRLRLHAAPGRLRADPAQLEQIVMNLAVNARDAMPHGGRLSIETDRASFDGAYASEHFEVTPGEYVMVAVSDTGVGMDRATRAHIFEPFFTTKGLGKGTGLGLSTIYGIVRQSGGHIWIYSEPGQGTTFKIYFPLVDEPASQTEQAPREIAGGSETVLLVEDEESVRELARAILQRKGYRVLVAADPREALAMLADHPEPIDILVSDVVMPGLSGPELARRIRQVRPEMRTLLLSGYTDDILGREGLLEGTDGFLSKPFSAEDLARKVGQIVGAARA